MMILRKINDKGISMMELIVVISIMAIVVGIASLSISLMFSRDAQRAAVLIDDWLSDARMQSMSKNDEVSLTIKTNAVSTNNSMELKVGTNTKTLKIDKSVLISLKGSRTADPGEEIKLVFNKSNGSVESVNDVDVEPNNNELYEIEVISQKGPAKIVNVVLIANTGRHYIVK